MKNKIAVVLYEVYSPTLFYFQSLEPTTHQGGIILSQSIRIIALLTLFLTADFTSVLLANDVPAAPVSNLTSSQEKPSNCRKICLFQISYRIARRREVVCADEVVSEQEAQEAHEGVAQEDLGAPVQDIACESEVADQPAENKISPVVVEDAKPNDAQTASDDTREAADVFGSPSEAIDDDVATDSVAADTADNDDLWQDPLSVEVDRAVEAEIAEQIREYEDELEQVDSPFDGVVEQSDEIEEDYYSTEEDTNADSIEYDTEEYYTDRNVDYNTEQDASVDSPTIEGNLKNQDFVESASGDDDYSNGSDLEELFPEDEYFFEDIPHAEENDNSLDSEKANDAEGNALESDIIDSQEVETVDPSEFGFEEAQSEDFRSLPELAIDPNLVKLIANWQNLSPEAQRKILEVVREDVQRVASDQTGLDE